MHIQSQFFQVSYPWALAARGPVVVNLMRDLTQEALPLKPCPLLVNEVAYAPPTSPHTPLSLKLGPAHPGAKGKRGEARATCQSILDCSPRPKTIGDVACPSHVLPTDQQTPPAGRVAPIPRWNIIKDDRRAPRARLRTPRRIAPTPATDVCRRRSL